MSRSARSQVLWIAIPTWIIGVVVSIFVVPLLPRWILGIILGIFLPIAFFIARMDPDSKYNIFAQKSRKHTPPGE